MRKGDYVIVTGKIGPRYLTVNKPYKITGFAFDGSSDVQFYNDKNYPGFHRQNELMIVSKEKNPEYFL